MRPSVKDASCGDPPGPARVGRLEMNGQGEQGVHVKSARPVETSVEAAARERVGERTRALSTHDLGTNALGRSA